MILLLLPACDEENVPRPEPLPPEENADESNVVHIGLQEGFAGDVVVIKLGGREIARREDVTTQLLLGYADTFDLEIPAGASNLTIHIPSRGLARTVMLNLPAEPHLGISIMDERIDVIAASEPFGYQ
jgi:hypothetical protein